MSLNKLILATGLSSCSAQDDEMPEGLQALLGSMFGGGNGPESGGPQIIMKRRMRDPIQELLSQTNDDPLAALFGGGPPGMGGMMMGGPPGLMIGGPEGMTRLHMGSGLPFFAAQPRIRVIKMVRPIHSDGPLEFSKMAQQIVQSHSSFEAPQIRMKIGSLMDMMGDHSGSFGLTGGDSNVEGLEPEADTVKIVVDAPGAHPIHNPVRVRMVGDTLVVSGTMHKEHTVSSFQRSYNLPSNIIKEKIKAAYVDDKLNVTIPKDMSKKPEESAKPLGEEKPENPAAKHLDDDLPPEIKSLHQSMHQFFDQLENIGDSKKSNMRGQQQKNDEKIDSLIPNLHGPDGTHALADPSPNSGLVQEEVEYVGCYKYEQLPEHKHNHLEDTHAAFFNALAHESSKDDHDGHKVEFFATARHGAPLSTGTVSYFHNDWSPPIEQARDDGKCGTPCDDDVTRFCGCANDEDRQNPHCEPNERIFAVYRIKDRAAIEKKFPKQAVVSTTTAKPTWRLLDNEAGDVTSIEILAPEEAFELKQVGKEVSIYGPPPAESITGVTTDVPSAEEVHDDIPKGKFIGKISLPLDLDTSNCFFATSEEAKHQVVRCDVHHEQVHHIPVHQEL